MKSQIREVLEQEIKKAWQFEEPIDYIINTALEKIMEIFLAVLPKDIPNSGTMSDKNRRAYNNYRKGRNEVLADIRKALK